MQATEGTQATCIGSKMQIGEHGRNVQKPSSPNGKGQGRGSVKQPPFSRGNNGGMPSSPSQC